MDQHLDDMASKTVSLMLATISGDEKSVQHVVVPVSLVYRATH